METGQATLRPSTITFVDTPALLHPFDRVPWKSDVFEALKGCDIVLLVIRAFNDSTVEHWKSPPSDYCDHYSHPGDEDSDEPEHAADDWQHKVSSLAVVNIMRAHDKKVLAMLRRNATNGDDLDTIEMIEDNVSGYRGTGLGGVITDERVRYHDWNERERTVLERLRLLTSKPIVYALNMDAEEFAIASSNESYLDDARTFIKAVDPDALVLPFTGRVLRDEAKASHFYARELSGASAILQKTIEYCDIGHFYTANKDPVAAWPIELITNVGEAVKLVNATLDSSVRTVEAVSMRDVVKAGSIEKALSSHCAFVHTVEDGDLLKLTPGKLEEVATDITDSMSTADSTDSLAVSASTLDPTGYQYPSAPFGTAGRCLYNCPVKTMCAAASGIRCTSRQSGNGVASGHFISLAFNVLLLVGLLAALLSNRELVQRVSTYIEERRRKREALVGAVRFHADNESLSL